MEDYELRTGASAGGEIHVWERRKLSASRVLKCTDELVSCATGAGREPGTEVFVAATKPSATSCSLATFLQGRLGASVGPTRCAAPEQITVVAASDNADPIVAAGGQSGRVYVWELSTGSMVVVFEAHIRAVRALTFSSAMSASSLVSAGDDAGCHLWSLPLAENASQSPLRSYEGHTLPVVAVAIRSTVLVTASLDRTVKGWHAPSGAALFTTLLSVPPLCLHMDISERFIAIGMRAGEVAIVDLVEGGDERTARTFRPGLRGSVRTIALSPAASEVIVGTDSGPVIVVDVASSVVTATYEAHKSAVVFLDTHPTRALRAPSGSDGASDTASKATYASRSGDALPTALPPLQRTKLNELGDYRPGKRLQVPGDLCTDPRSAAVEAIAMAGTMRLDRVAPSGGAATTPMQPSGPRVEDLEEEIARLRGAGAKLLSLVVDEIQR